MLQQVTAALAVAEESMRFIDYSDVCYESPIIRCCVVRGPS